MKEYKTIEKYHDEMKFIAKQHNVSWYIEDNPEEYLDEWKCGVKPIDAVKSAFDNAEFIIFDPHS